MRRVAVEHLARHQAPPAGQFHHLIEDLLIHIAVAKTPPPVLAQRRGVRHLVGQLQPQKPPVGRVALHLAHQLPLAADAEQIPDQQQLEQHHRIQCRSPIVLAVQMPHPFANELQIDGPLDPAQQMIARNQRLYRHHLHLLLLYFSFFQHVGIKTQSSRGKREPCLVLCQQSEPRPKARFFIGRTGWRIYSFGSTIPDWF